MSRLSVVIPAVLLFVFALGAPLLPLQLPFFTSVLSARYSLAEAAGLPPATMQAIAEDVRVFVVAGEGELPETVDGRPAFDASAVSHLRDVAEVISAARTLTIALGLGLAVWVVVAVRRGRSGDVGRALLLAALAIAIGVVLALVIAVVDFGAFFSGFHALFFAEGTWTFPYDSLLIRLFPEPFWTAAGLSWAAGIAVLATAYGVAGGVLVRRERIRA